MARVLCIGGLDSTGRAGLVADAWAVTRAGGEPLCVATALTAQGGRRFALNPVSPRVLEAQLDAALGSGRVHAVKLGMIADRRQLAVILRACRRARAVVVVDPVTRTSRGEQLSTLLPRDYRALAKLGAVITPNQAELAWLGGSAEALVGLGFRAVLVKGGDSAVDALFTRKGRRLFRGRPRRRDPVRHRGTGCRLAAALAAHVGEGATVQVAVRRARAIVLQFLTGL